jgi:threonine 3-dehydrogenase
VVITDVNPFRLELARKMGATVAANISQTSLGDVQKQLGMLEGFDVGLEMSGNGEALHDMLANMSHGAKIALLGIPKRATVVDLNPIIFKLLTIKGIYGREMYETWYKMTMMLQCGLDIRPVISHRFSFEDFHKGFEAMCCGECAKVILNWA